MKLFISAQSIPGSKPMPFEGEPSWVDDVSDDELGKPASPDFSDVDVRRLAGALAEIQHYSNEAMRKLNDLKLQYQHISHHEAISAINNELKMIQLMNSRLSY